MRGEVSSNKPTHGKQLAEMVVNESSRAKPSENLDWEIKLLAIAKVRA
jgi:hypothetical protein